jgi:spermidine/putrescine transport system permease protein
MASRRSAAALLLSSPLTILAIVFIIGPLAIFAIYSFFEPRPFGVVTDLTVQNYVDVLERSSYWTFMRTSLVVAMWVASLSVIFGYVLAYEASLHAARSKGLLLALIVGSILGGYLVRIYAWRTILGSNGVLNSALIRTGVIDDPLGFVLFSKVAVVIALISIYIPFCGLILFAALENVKREQIEAARTLGAHPVVAFWRITLPLTGRAVFAAFAFAFLLTAADYVTPQLVGGISGTMVGVSVSDQFIKVGNWALGSAMSFVMIGVFGAVLAAVRIILRSAGVIARAAP